MEKTVEQILIESSLQYDQLQNGALRVHTDYLFPNNESVDLFVEKDATGWNVSDYAFTRTTLSHVGCEDGVTEITEHVDTLEELAHACDTVAKKCVECYTEKTKAVH